MKRPSKPEIWSLLSLSFFGIFVLFLVYPMFGILKQSVLSAEGKFTLQEFIKFFSQPYYFNTIFNSFKVSVAITITALFIGILISYFYSFYHIRGAKILFVVSILCSMLHISAKLEH